MSCLGLLVLCTAVGWAEPTVDVGVARKDVTPEYSIRLNGFGFRRDESEGVRRPIYVRAIAIGTVDSGGPFVLIAAETLGIPDEVHRRVAEALAKHSVRRERVAIVATHTHTGPMINAVSPTLFGEPIPAEHQQHIDQYSEQFVASLIAVAESALRDRRPSILQWGRGQVGFARNRRQEGGPVDHQLPVLAVYDLDRKLRAIWTTYACHCVTLSDNKISGDWAGYASDAIERIYPGCTALVSIGCGADANPSSGVAGDRADLAEAQGAEIATEVARLIRDGLMPLAPPTMSHYDRISLPLADHPSQEEWQARAERQDAVGYHARVQLERIARGQALVQAVDYPIQTWDFGEQLSVVFLPGEVVVDYALRLRNELAGDRLWINAYANHCPGYIPSERVLREGGYEAGGAMVYYDLPGPYAAGLENRIVQTVTRQVAQPKPDPGGSPTDDAQGVVPHDDEAALAHFEVPDGWHLELVAAEPLVQSPVAIAFGLDGTLWVAEMFDYPAGLDGNFQPGGRIKRLTDRDEDGRYDHATVFLSDIPFPTGVTVWRDGVLVCAAPNILFARDNDGDGRADEVRTLYSGFGTENYQARVNSLEYGLDGWVYGSCGLFGGEIITEDGHTISLGNRDFRIQPDRGTLEPAVGRTQQGRVRDDSGNWFGCDNGQFIYHYPFPDHYLRRNPYAPAMGAARSILAGDQAGRVFPVSKPTLFPLSGPAGIATAACGLAIYRDDYLGEELQGNSFTCEPVNNLVTRRILREHATSWLAERSEQERSSEIVRSSDPWFRPVQARTGPDGALWIVDMHRLVIEHPRWIPAESLANLDVRAGAESGRIYRLVRSDRPPQSMRIGDGTSLSLIGQLGSSNGTRRDLATMALGWLPEGQTEGLVGVAQEQLRRAEAPRHVLHLLAVLDAWQQLDTTQLLTALRHHSPLVRRHALRIAEEHAGDQPEVTDAVVQSANDSSLSVRFQAAFSLGHLSGDAAAQAIAQLMCKPDGHDDIRAAAMTSLHAGNLAAVIEFAMRREGETPPAVLQELAKQAAAWDLLEAAVPLVETTSITEWLKAPTDTDRLPNDESLARIAALMAGVRIRGQSVESLEARLPRLGKVVAACRSLATHQPASSDLRILAIKVLGESTLATDQNAMALLSLLTPQVDLAVQQAAVAALEQNGLPEIPRTWARSWHSYSPAIRARMVEAMLKRSLWAAELLKAMEATELGWHELSDTQREALRNHPDASVREQAETLFASNASSRANDQPEDDLTAHIQALEQFAQGDLAAGEALFQQKCAVCHRVGDRGQAVGPDLANYTTKPAASFAISVARPNDAIDPRYISYTAVTEDGRIFAGIISEEDANAVVLQMADGKQVTIARHELDELRSNGVSLMPTGLARELSPSAMRDLWAYIQHSAAKQRSQVH